MPAGRPKKPTAQKIMDGETRPERLNVNQPRPKPVAPKCPDYLTGRAVEEWNIVGAELEKLGLLTKVDGNAFCDYCWLCGECADMMELLHKGGMLKKTPNAHVAPKAQFTILRDMMKLKNQLANQFGLTPSARERLSVAPAEMDDAMTKLLE